MTSRPPASDEASPAWSQLGTESQLEASRSLDTLPTDRVVELLLEEDRRGLDAALRRSAEIAVAAEKVAATLQGGGDVVFVGAGTSGRLGVLEAAECPPTFGTDPARIRAAIAGGEDAVFRAKEGAEDRDDAGRKVARELSSGDFLIGLSASSVTPYARAALAEARRRGLATLLVTCADGKGLGDAADQVIALATGAEVLTGSTRLKAGSATKAALNAITTAAMVRLGKVFDNLMVDLRPGSAKLVDRAQRIVGMAGRVTEAQAAELLSQTDGEVKTAIVMARCGVTVDQARERLKASRGHIRAALSPSS